MYSHVSGKVNSCDSITAPSEAASEAESMGLLWCVQQAVSSEHIHSNMKRRQMRAVSHIISHFHRFRLSRCPFFFLFFCWVRQTNSGVSCVRWLRALFPSLSLLFHLKETFGRCLSEAPRNFMNCSSEVGCFLFPVSSASLEIQHF